MHNISLYSAFSQFLSYEYPCGFSASKQSDSSSHFNNLWESASGHLQSWGCHATALSPYHAPDIEPSRNYNYNINHKM